MLARSLVFQWWFIPIQAHLHHYTQVDGMDAGLFAESLESLTSLIAEYDKLDTSQQHTPKTEIPRLKVL